MSAAQARRVALAAQGFLDRRHERPTMRTLSRTIERTGVLQIDSVNVLQRAHFMPLYSRMGPYDVSLLERASSRKPRRLVEYWAHVAAYMPVELWPVMVHRMRDYEQRGHAWANLPDERLPDALLREIETGGAATARDLDDGLPRTRDNWGWNWSNTKVALEYLFVAGKLAVSKRNSAFERVYDLPERVIPAEILARPEPTVEEAARELIRRAARSYGVATEFDLRDYFRMQHSKAHQHQVRPAIAALVEDGELLPVDVEGWGRPAYLHRDARLPRTVDARALLSPFDPVVWERDRTLRLFDFFYRIEIYVPQAKRVHGYYVLPFLLGDRIVARVDLKADRRGGLLHVAGSYAEPHAPGHTAQALADALRELAGWLGLSGVDVARRGDLAPALAAAVA
ncbi:winged helix-turn-helix domain-containing protein [Flexivirga sp. ID2601S]|uniref:Winged helix-turn-helix domain-containing protein n=2 Tax=Flexivirga aerilata TaxID=1656889 RepID=A0A849AJV7_9MICO|nr:crosslink repair DNA glycosylase YcaQ family protein [Flexivirga aerilata]NNG40649.1 winged helix-turn-helix domain-containing protein [Flexivirga aerilata]